MILNTVKLIKNEPTAEVVYLSKHLHTISYIEIVLQVFAILYCLIWERAMPMAADTSKYIVLAITGAAFKWLLQQSSHINFVFNGALGRRNVHYFLDVYCLLFFLRLRTKAINSRLLFPILCVFYLGNKSSISKNIVFARFGL